MKETYVKIGEAARMLGISPSTLSTWQDKKILIPAQIFPSGHRRYSVSQIEEFIKTHENTSKLDTTGVDEDEIYMTSKETAKYMGVSVSMVNSLEEKGELVPRRKLPTNNRRFYAQSDVDAFLERISNH
jgi:DNA-binding transcriptional MerR regulator